MVALSLRSIDIMSDGSIVVKVQPPSDARVPVPAEKLTGGTRMLPPRRFAYVIHDNLNPGTGYMARTLWSDKIIGDITNEFYVPRRWYFRVSDGTWRVDQYSKIEYYPEALAYRWPEYFFSGMTERQHELFNASGTGWRDSKANTILAWILRLFTRLFKRVFGIIPEGVAPFRLLLPGGTLLRKLFEWREWTIFACQDTDMAPAWETYDTLDRVFKQGVCGDNGDTSFYGSVDQDMGDLFIPNACPGGMAAILTAETREIFDLPHDTFLDGIPVTIAELWFKQSEVFCRLKDTEDWYYLLEQRTKNGNAKDFVLHIPADEWPVLPVPVVNRQKGIIEP